MSAKTFDHFIGSSNSTSDEKLSHSDLRAQEGWFSFLIVGSSLQIPDLNDVPELGEH